MKSSQAIQLVSVKIFIEYSRYGTKALKKNMKFYYIEKKKGKKGADIVEKAGM